MAKQDRGNQGALSGETSVDGNASHNASRRAIASFKGAKCGICGTVALAAIKEDGTALGVMKLRAPMREGRSIGLITALYQDDEIERLEEEKEAVGVVVDLEEAEGKELELMSEGEKGEELVLPQCLDLR